MISWIQRYLDGTRREWKEVVDERVIRFIELRGNPFSAFAIEHILPSLSTRVVRYLFDVLTPIYERFMWKPPKWKSTRETSSSAHHDAHIHISHVRCGSVHTSCREVTQRGSTSLQKNGFFRSQRANRRLLFGRLGSFALLLIDDNEREDDQIVAIEFSNAANKLRNEWCMNWWINTIEDWGFLWTSVLRIMYFSIKNTEKYIAFAPWTVWQQTFFSRISFVDDIMTFYV